MEGIVGISNDCMVNGGMGGTSVRMRGSPGSLLARIAPAGPRVVHAFALPVHPSISFRAGFLGAAALVSNFAHTFRLRRTSS